MELVARPGSSQLCGHWGKMPPITQPIKEPLSGPLPWPYPSHLHSSHSGSLLQHTDISCRVVINRKEQALQVRDTGQDLAVCHASHLASPSDT